MVKIRAYSVADLSADPANVRRHSERNIAAIKASLRRFGQQKPIVVDAAGVVVAGNGTLEAAKQLDWPTILGIETKLVGSDRTAYAIADNRTAELGEWDDEALAKIIKELEAEDYDLDAVGYTEQEIAELLNGEIMPGLTDPDDVPLPPDAAITQSGDLIILGSHRLLCGDSGNPADVDRLLDGAKAQLVNTDPPDGVKVEPRSNNAVAAGLSSFAPDSKAQLHHQGFDQARFGHRKPTHEKLRPKDRPLLNDFASAEDFDKMLAA